MTNPRRLCRYVAPVTLFVVLCLSVSCVSPSSPPRQEDEPSDAEGFPVVFPDDLQNEVSIPRRPERVVCLAPSNTEIVFALGVGSRVVGVDDYSNFPPEAAEVESIGGYSTASVEKIVSLRPDLVLGTEADVDIAEQLRRAGVPTMLLYPRTLDGVMESISKIGRALGESEAAEDLRRRLEDRLRKVKVSNEGRASSPPKVYYEVCSDPMMTVGPGALIHEVIVAAGGRNVFEDAVTRYPVVSSEAVVERDPDVILFPAAHGTESLTAEDFRSRPGWARVSAVRNERVHVVDSDVISRPGPRIVDAVEAVASLID